MNKLAASKHRFSVPQSRAGRRSMSVDTMLRKDKEGTLFSDKSKLAGVLRRPEDILPGGLADNKKPSDFDQKALAKGTKVESEHTSIPAVAQEIAMDHLTEDKDYYDKLEKMESEEKAAGILGDLWEAAKKPIPGTPQLIMAAEDPSLRTTGTQALGAIRKKVPAVRTVAGVTHLGDDYMKRLGFDPNMLKHAAPRAVKMWQEAQAKGDKATMKAVEQAYGKLELPPRHLRDLGAGAEGLAMQMLGGATPTGYKVPEGTLVQKLYDPNGHVHQGALSKKVLEDKQRISDAFEAQAVARGERTPLVARMYGHQEVAPGKNVSFHEFVPHTARQVPMSDVRELARKLEKGAPKGTQVADAAWINPMGELRYNAGNVVADESGKLRVLDFLPAGKSYVRGDPRREMEGILAAQGVEQWKDYVEKTPTELKKAIYSNADSLPTSNIGPSRPRVAPPIQPRVVPPARQAAVSLEESPVHVSPSGRLLPMLGGAALLGGAGYLGYKAYQGHKKSQEQQKTSEVKLADSWKPQWLELSYTEGERGMQNTPVRGKIKPGDAPSADTDTAFAQGGRMTPTYLRPETMLAAKTADVLSPNRARLLQLAQQGAQKLAPAAEEVEQAAVQGLHNRTVGTLLGQVHMKPVAYPSARGEALRFLGQAPQDIIRELPAVRSGVSPETAFNLMGQDPAAAQHALLGMWDSTTPVHAMKSAIKAASIGRLVTSPTETMPTVDMQTPNRMQHELGHIGIVGTSPDPQPLTGSSSDEYKRASADITPEEAEAAKLRIQSIQRTTPGENARMALVGAVASPIVQNTGRLLAGTAKYIDPETHKINWKTLGRQTLADSTTGAIAGGITPYIRGQVEKSHRQKVLRRYENQEAANA